MSEQMKKSDADILVGPPGLLFGLMLFVFLTARIYSGMLDSEPENKVADDPLSSSDIVCQAVAK